MLYFCPLLCLKSHNSNSIFQMFLGIKVPIKIRISVSVDHGNLNEKNINDDKRIMPCFVQLHLNSAAFDSMYLLCYLS